MGEHRRAGRHLRLIQLLFSIGLFLVLLAIFYSSPVRTSIDSRWAVHTAMSFARGHWGDLSEYRPILEKEGPYIIEYYKGRPHTYYPIGVSVLSVPAMAVVSLFHPSFNMELRYGFPIQLEGLLAASFGALIGVLFFWTISARFNSYYLALVSMTILCFCTSVWSTATRALWQHAPLVLVFVVAMGLLLKAQAQPAVVQYLALLLVMAFIIRPTAAVAILVFSLYVLICYRRWFIPYLLWSLLLAVPWCVYNLLVYGALLPSYYLRTASYSAKVFGEALLGNLFSPARGLFVYSPVLLFALPGFVLSLRERKERWLHMVFGTIIVLHWLAVSRFAPTWWAGHSYGPRLMTDVLPFLVYFLSFTLRVPGAGRLGRVATAGGVVLLAGVSCLMHARGALDEAPSRWNIEPVNVDYAPGRVWDWHDPQFARDLGYPVLPPLLNPLKLTMPTDVKLYDSGVIVHLQGLGFDPSVLGSGWSVTQSWGIWSDGFSAQLLIDVGSVANAGDLLMIARTIGFVTSSQPQQQVDVLVNDTPVALWVFEEGNTFVERRAWVPAAIIGVKMPLVVTFRPHNFVSAAELGLNADSRRLGIGLTSLHLVPAEGK